MPSLLAEQKRGWSLMIFCARATRGLGRPSLHARTMGNRQTIPLKSERERGRKAPSMPKH